MSFWSSLLHPFQKVEDIVEEIVPADLISKYGSYAHTIAANIMHDAAVALKAGEAVAIPMTKTLVASVIAAVEQEAAALAPQVLSGKVSFSDAVSTAVGNLKSEAATTIVPGLKVIGQATLQTVVSTAVETAIATVAGSPTSSSASSSVASSPGASSNS